jgi:hypothetical protein
MTDDEPERESANPEEFHTFDQYDPNLDPPERPDEPEPTREGDEVASPRGVPAGTVMSAVGLLRVTYNKR